VNQQKRKPDRAQVCIIGAGASGATAAKVLTEHGIHVVTLEKGPHQTKEEYGGDELANAHRYFLWPDPDLNPRTFRFTANEEPWIENLCPVPQAVGGGTVHWTGWVPRFVATDFVQHSLHGDIPGASLADWPISYWDLEPYYTKVEWALGVSGQAGANKYESPRSKGYPCPPMPPTRYASIFRRGCKNLGLNSFPTPTAMLSQEYSGRPPTVQSAFVQQHGDPSGTRSNMLFTFATDALRTGRWDLRPNSYVREITVGHHGWAASVIYQDADGNVTEQEADLVIVACGAIETARLLLLSRSNAFPQGLSNGNGLVGKYLTLHEFTAAVGVFDEPVYGWAGGGYISASTFEFYTSDYRRGFIGGCHVAGAGVGIPLPISFSLPGKPHWGAAAKDWDREFFNHSMAAGIVLYDLSQEASRVELDDTVTDAWGLPVSRITVKPHPNDLAMGRWVVDRCAEILEAAGAKKVWRAYVNRITGNCSHQHGTTRMGNDPGSSVVNKYCRAHEVENLYVVDGGPFPNSTGANPTLSIMANAWRVAEHIARNRGYPA